MDKRLLLPLLLALSLVGSTACSSRRKAPVAPPPAPVVAPAEVAPSPAPAPEPREADPVPSPLDADLLAADEFARREGLLGDVHFDLDESTLRSDARERLARNGDFLRSRPEFLVTIEGHCDERGTNEYNLALGERRSQAAREYLVSLGIEPSRMLSISYGEERPSCAESAEGCWQRNRRAHFRISGRRG